VPAISEAPPQPFQEFYSAFGSSVAREYVYPDYVDQEGNETRCYGSVISAADSTMRLNRGTTSTTSSCAQNLMSSSRPGGP
jgi:hypothetical protein